MSEAIQTKTTCVGERVEQLLDVLGETRLDSAPYDTAWVARLGADFDDPAFTHALEWVRKHQQPDGSWGAEPLYYHDRFVSTLASLIALQTAGGTAEDKRKIEHGERFLWENLGRLNVDSGDTIAFPILIVSLLREALRHGLDVPASVTHNVAIIEKKLNMLGGDPKRWRYTSMSFSLEAVPPYLPDQSVFASTDFILENGSIGTSPAATAAYLLQTKQHNTAMIDYLKAAQEKQGDGGIPDITPAEIFEVAWSLHILTLSGAIKPDHPVVKRHLDVLWKHWSPSNGTSCSQYFPVPDLDDTATVFGLLRWGGYPVHADVFKYYEDEQHFKCYPGEADVSLSVNIRTLAALQTERAHPQFSSWSGKIGAMLRYHDLNNHLWFDKWHISPYYLTSVAICSLPNNLNDLLPKRVRWIIKTQQPDGGWGYFNGSTPEETALCLLALLHWNKHVEHVDPDVLDSAARYVERYSRNTIHPAFYVGKCLYMPLHVVRATILSALHSYALYKEG
ncbi:MAG: hypothetical protein JXQ72_04845 [Anaerolineae bacterium]|nr:hypothetical protein [Anaerolineae bacterium]